MQMGEKLAETQEMPAWLHALISEEFFNPCSVHERLKKNEKNILCIDCCLSLCSHCLTSHDPHRFLQIRRYMYHYVVRVKDLEKLIDFAGIQPYKNNYSKVVFINERTQIRKSSSYDNPCHACNRGIPQNYLYCSLSCKVKELLKMDDRLTNYLKACESLPMPNSAEFDECELSPHSIFETTSSGSTASGSDALSPVGLDQLSGLPGRRRLRKQLNPQRSWFF